MYDFEVPGAFTRDSTERVLSLAHKLCFRRVVCYEKTGEHTCHNALGCTHYRGMMLRLDDGSSFHVAAGDQSSRNAIFYGVLKHVRYGWGIAEIQDEFDRLAAVYWVASQQSWKDLAEDLVPYLIAAIGGDEKTTTKRQRV